MLEVKYATRVEPSGLEVVWDLQFPQVPLEIMPFDIRYPTEEP